MSHQEDHSFQPHDYLRILKRRKALFFGVLLFTFAAVLLGHWAQPKVDTTTPIAFRSELKLLVTPPSTENQVGESENLTTWFASEQLLKQLLLSEELLSRVIDAGSLELDWQALRGAIAFAPSDPQNLWNDAWGSFMLELEVEADSPEESQEIAQLLSNEIVTYTQELGAREAIASRKLLEKMALKSKTQIEKAQRDIVAWRKANDVWDIDQLIEAQGARITNLENQRDAQQAKVTSLQQRVNQLESYKALSPQDLPRDIVELEQRSLTKGAAERARLTSELRNLRSVYTDQSHVVQEKRREYDEAMAEYAQDRRVFFDSLISQERKEMSEVQALADQFQAEILALKQDDNLAKGQAELQRLQYELASLRTSYEQIVEQINETKVLEQKKKHLANFTVVEKPQLGAAITLPGSKTNIQAVLGMAVFLSLMAAAGATALVETFARSNHMRTQIEALGLPILGTIPKIDTSKIDGHRFMADQPDTIFAERFRSLIVNILRMDKKVHKILVTSCWPEEGKSLVSVNLALGFGRFGMKVFLADGDLRRPFLTKYFKKEKDPGLRQFLTEELPLVELSQPTDLDNVNILPAGLGDDNAAELLMGKKSLAPLVDDSDQKLLIIDSSPLSVCSDSIMLSDDVDGVILVVNGRHFEGRPELDHVIELEEQGVPVLGLVLNNVKETELGYGFSDYTKVSQSYYGQKKPSVLNKLFRR